MICEPCQMGGEKLARAMVIAGGKTPYFQKRLAAGRVPALQFEAAALHLECRGCDCQHVTTASAINRGQPK